MLKDATTNSLLQLSTLFKQQRLIIVTGKGGVGKTTLAMALANSLSKQGHNVLYNSFDQPHNDQLLNSLNIPFLDLDLESSAQSYMAKKLNSETIAKWILKTPFFHSLFNMLPGLGHMILLGHLINMLEENPELTIVIDSPSSGHALTMIESPANFKEMFKTGLIVDDINRMENFLFDGDKLLTLITALPTSMAVQEAKDLHDGFKKRGIKEVQMIINNILYSSPDLKNLPDDVPEFLQKRFAIEEELLSNQTKDWKQVPHYIHDDGAKVIDDITNQLLKEGAN